MRIVLKPVAVYEMIEQAPNPDCPDCHGKGHHKGLKCLCIFAGSKELPISEAKPLTIDVI